MKLGFKVVISSVLKDEWKTDLLIDIAESPLIVPSSSIASLSSLSPFSTLCPLPTLEVGNELMAE